MGEPCRKCKAWRPLPGDTWCVACSAWETIGLELVGAWSGPAGLRSIANDLVLGCAPEVRALRAVGAGLGRAPAASDARASAAGSGRAPSPSAPSTAAKVKPEEPPASEYTYEEESEEETNPKAIDKRPALVRKTPPPAACESRGEDRSSRGEGVKEERLSEDRRERKEERSRGKRSREEEEREEKRKGGKEKKDKSGKDKEKKKGKRRRRGGRKHQRLHRLVEDPYRPHHRKLSSAFLEGRDDL